MLPIVTEENYFSPETQMAYMGASQFKAFQKCEAAALAELKGEYVRPSSTDLLIGSFVDAYFGGTLPLFTAQHPELFKKDGNLKSDYVHAQDIISRMESDDLYMALMSGEKQVIRTGKIAGVPFKIKIDSLLDGLTCEEIVKRFPETALVFGPCDGAIVDQKVMKDMASVWSDEEKERQSFVEAWGYDVQGAIYQAIEGHMLPFILAVGTKEKTPDIGAIQIADEDLSEKLMEIEDAAPRYQAIKEGKIAPSRCEHCDYCKATRELKRIINYKDLEV